ncbi:fumarylacetoacetate hydrolase family protein [Cryptosporangium sp. NPDC048952]|uniref:fumarylacetoacetate hydrolase family protein n=1 Tax=Cryptosporangium sp. NPDC048952 TaxID=3363961 RepID=UPI00371511E6
MRLAHARTAGGDFPVVHRDDQWYDLRPLHAAVTPAVLAPSALQAIRSAELPAIDAPETFAPPLKGIGKILCIGLNYTDHAEETGATAPAEPILFMKAPDTVNAPNDDVLIPRTSVKTDYEVELAIVLGSTARYLASPDEALAHVAGYAVSNDVSERTFQIERGGQWDKGKNCETFNPFGPWIETDVADPQDLDLKLWVNGDLRQNGNTKNQIFGVAHVVWYLSQFMTLYPGDVINTGTPAGVAMGRSDGAYLRDGDVVELEITGLGRQRHTFRQA